FGGGSNDFEAIRYEGYGPGGVAILVEALTDNRNRTAADLRAAFSKNGGNLGETGCVSWMFDRKGMVEIAGTVDEEKLLEVSLDGGAESYELLEGEDAQGAEVICEANDLERLSQALQGGDFSVVQAELRWIPTTTMEVTDTERARSLLKLMDALEESDDVQNVTANFEMGDELISQMLE
ncbi:YebC/PmpR family DNA-binding transcriptional regulator, partial [Oscillatoriales cyanobacterium LEGE 11467]